MRHYVLVLSGHTCTYLSHERDGEERRGGSFLDELIRLQWSKVTGTSLHTFSQYANYDNFTTWQRPFKPKWIQTRLVDGGLEDYNRKDRLVCYFGGWWAFFGLPVDEFWVFAWGSPFVRSTPMALTAHLKRSSIRVCVALFKRDAVWWRELIWRWMHEQECHWAWRCIVDVKVSKTEKQARSLKVQHITDATQTTHGVYACRLGAAKWRLLKSTISDAFTSCHKRRPWKH